VRIAHAIFHEIALVVAGRANGFAIAQGQGRHGFGFTRMLDADHPGLIALLAQRHHIAADIDQRIEHSLLAQIRGGVIQRPALGKAAQIDFDLTIAAFHQRPVEFQIIKAGLHRQ